MAASTRPQAGSSSQPGTAVIDEPYPARPMRHPALRRSAVVVQLSLATGATTSRKLPPSSNASTDIAW